MTLRDWMAINIFKNFENSWLNKVGIHEMVVDKCLIDIHDKHANTVLSFLSLLLNVWKHFIFNMIWLIASDCIFSVCIIPTEHLNALLIPTVHFRGVWRGLINVSNCFLVIFSKHKWFSLSIPSAIKWISFSIPSKAKWISFFIPSKAKLINFSIPSGGWTTTWFDMVIVTCV